MSTMTRKQLQAQDCQRAILRRIDILQGCKPGDYDD